VGEFYNVFQNEPVDVSEEFSRQENHFFVAVSKMRARCPWGDSVA
jgi:hypothetical protein